MLIGPQQYQIRGCSYAININLQLSMNSPVFLHGFRAADKCDLCLFLAASTSRHDAVVLVHLLTPIVGATNCRTRDKHTHTLESEKPASHLNTRHGKLAARETVRMIQTNICAEVQYTTMSVR